jgi:Flp pilus assembly protein TadG
MAFVAPFLLLLIIGVTEFGWLFGEFNEIRHAARDGARFAAVSEPDLDGDLDFDEDDVLVAVCNALNLAGSGTVDLDIQQVSGDQIGDTARLTLTMDTPSLTGAPLITGFLPSSLTNEVLFRLEQPAEWSDQTFTDQC